jgi:hypothetical protein
VDLSNPEPWRLVEPNAAVQPAPEPDSRVRVDRAIHDPGLKLARKTREVTAIEFWLREARGS